MRSLYLFSGLLAGATFGGAQHYRHPMVTPNAIDLRALGVLQARQEECQLAGDTPCAGGPAAGCCPRGAACIVSDGIPACNELCDGTQCAVGGCCGFGLTCPTVRAGFCSAGAGPSLTIPSIAPLPTLSSMALPTITGFGSPTSTSIVGFSHFTPVASGGSASSVAASTARGSDSPSPGGSGGGGGGGSTGTRESPLSTFTGGDGSGQGISATSMTSSPASRGGAVVVGGRTRELGLFIGGMMGMWWM